MKKVSEILEYNQIIKQVLGNTHSEATIIKYKNIGIYDDFSDLIKAQNLLQSMIDILNSYFSFPLGQFTDISTYLSKVKMDGILTPLQLLEINYQNDIVLEIIDFKEEKLISENLLEFIDGLIGLETLNREIRDAIDIQGKIRDSASITLANLRRQELNINNNIRSKMDELSHSYKDYLYQETISYRQDHLVLPIKASFQNKVRGVVYGVSSSGQTVYIEPQPIVELNNRLYQVQESIFEEEQKILKDLSSKVSNVIIELESNQELLIDLDFLLAKANYAYKNKYILPDVNLDYDSLIIKEARHPLIDVNKVVANDIVLNNKKIFLISGSNTGGKTVVLKTVGLLSMMALSGFAIPCTNAKIPFFNNILVDLGDEQSIEQSLSTFSSHVNKLISITHDVNSKSLVLLDEIGSGTDPQEGQALAQAVLEYLEDIGCFVVSTTHYSLLKQYAKTNDNVVIASVEFNQELMAPTYRLIYDSVGSSYAFEISQKLGLNKSIIERSKELKMSQMNESDLLLEKLEKEREVLIQKKDEYDNLLLENEKINTKLIKQLDNISKQKERIINQAKQDANQLLEDGKIKIDEVINELKEQELIKQHNIIDSKRKLDLFKHESPKIKVKENPELKIGDQVQVISLNRIGEIISISSKGIIQVNLNGMKVNVKNDEVAYIGKKSKIKPIKSMKSAVKTKANLQYELNLIGKRYVEAMEELDKFLDSALLNNATSVRIIHGLGNGILRNGVRKHLDKCNYIASYRDGGINEGGLGATLVFFE